MRTGTGAAEEIAGCGNRLARIGNDLTLLKWMMSPNLALSPVLLVGAFRS